MPLGGTLPLPRILVSRAFRRWQRQNGIADQAIAVSVAEMRAGLIDADLGGSLVKKRMAVSGGGKRGGARVLVATNRGDRWIFLLGFMKNAQDNLAPGDLAPLRGWAAELLALTGKQLDRAKQDGRLHEIDHHPTTPH